MSNKASEVSERALTVLYARVPVVMLFRDIFLFECVLVRHGATSVFGRKDKGISRSFTH
jgi:hypothetical protein